MPAGMAFSKDAAQRGLNWFAQWFQNWSLNLMVQDYINKEGNAKLVEMNAQIRRDLPALRDLLDASFSTHVRAEPTLVRGCYFVACGPEPENHAFIAGLVRGPRSKMIADASYTSWSGGAEEVERRYRRLSLGLGLATLALALPIWILGIRHYLVKAGIGPWPFWAGLGLLSCCWLVGLSLPWIRARIGRPARI